MFSTNGVNAPVSMTPGLPVAAAGACSAVIALAKPTTAQMTAANCAHFLKLPIHTPPSRFSRPLSAPVVRMAY